MRQCGFTLIELIVVTAIIGILSTIGTISFNEWTRKSNIESQTKMMYADLMTVRGEAAFLKRERAVTFEASRFSIYSSTEVTVAPTVRKTVAKPMVSDNAARIEINTLGSMNFIPAASQKIICIEPNDNPGSYDSIIITNARIQMGKRKNGQTCSSANVTAK